MWSEDELRHATLGDKRLNVRLMRMVYDLAAQPMSSVPEACGSWAATKATYRFWSSERVTAEAIRSSHGQRTVERVSEHSTVLAIQDTTDLDLTSHRAMRGRGPLSFGGYQGLKVHSVLTVSAGGVPLGVIDQQVWARDPLPVQVPRYKRTTDEKESQRWLKATKATSEAIPASTRVITVADREADFFDLFAQGRPAHSHLLIRAAHNRRVSEETGSLWETVAAQAAQGTYRLSVSRRADRSPSEVTLEVRYAAVTIRAPLRGDCKASPPVPMYAIVVQEVNPPAEVKPIQWRLLTSLTLSTLGEAMEAVRWYSYRWLIERYHYVLKSGCRIESLQLQTASQLEKALATYGIVAWRLLWLVHQSRQAPDTPASEVFSESQWQALYATIHRTTTPPPTVPTLHQAVRWIAQLGGFLARTGDGDPGVKTLWLGLRRLDDIAATWRLLHDHSPDSPIYG